VLLFQIPHIIVFFLLLADIRYFRKMKTAILASLIAGAAAFTGQPLRTSVRMIHLFFYRQIDGIYPDMDAYFSSPLLISRL